MPIAESGTYHGYDVVDYRKVEQDYGTSADFKALLAAAHRRGIKVIVDMVLNHSSSDNAWFLDAKAPGSVHDDWYIWADANPGYLGPDGQVVWRPSGKRWYYAVFSETMPDLNLRNPAVTAELKDIARFWLVDVGVDGFRLDAAKHLIEDSPKQQVHTPATLAWLASYKAAVDAAKPGAMLIGEVWAPATMAGRYVPGSLDLDFNFPLADAVRAAITSGSGALLNTAFDDTIRAWPPNQAASFLTNHDQDRIMSQLGGDSASAGLAAFILMTEPGVPFVYYGEEIGMQGRKPDERIRTPMQWTADGPAGGFSTATPWEPLADGWETVNVAAQTADPASLLSTYRRLIALRGSTAALRDGGTTLLDDTGADAVTGWLRTTVDQTLLAVVNVGDQPVTDYGLTLRNGPLCGARTARVVTAVGGDPMVRGAAPTADARGGFTAWKPFDALPARSGYLLALDPAP
jgi:glycosidase